MSFYKNYLNLCNSIGKSPSKVATEIGLSPATPTVWKKGALPHPNVMNNICNYFGVTEDYFKNYKSDVEPDYDIIITKSYLYGNNPPSEEEWNELLKFVEWQKFKKTTKGK